jgi:hypothetical protein
MTGDGFREQRSSNAASNNHSIGTNYTFINKDRPTCG